MKVKDLIAQLHNAAGGDHNFYDAEVVVVPRPLGSTGSVRSTTIGREMPDQTPVKETSAAGNDHEWKRAEPGGLDSCGRCGIFRFAYYARAERRPCPVPTVATVKEVALVAVADEMNDRLVQVIQLTLTTGVDELSEDEANEALDEDGDDWGVKLDELTDEDIARAEAGETPLEREQRKLDEAGEAAHNKAMFGE
jgi:hypothetical protein